MTITAELDQSRWWDTDAAVQALQAGGEEASRRTVERRLVRDGIWPELLSPERIQDENATPVTPSVFEFELAEARSARHLALFVQLCQMPDGNACLHANDGRRARYWHPFTSAEPGAADVLVVLNELPQWLDRPLVIFPHGAFTAICRHAAPAENLRFALLGYAPVLDLPPKEVLSRGREAGAPLTHLDRLEAEAIFILREAVTEAENPVMMYSIGKDSAVMLHLARKAFYPGTPPFPLLHVDTKWKFREMYLFRQYMAEQTGMKLMTYTNPEVIEQNINPFDHGSALHTDIAKTEALKQALDMHKFDVIFGGARRDEEKSRAKERVFSFRSQAHRWDPKKQRPELWNLYNAKKAPGESIRVFPLSNWTELDIWQYIYRENIPIVPLYFAKERPVIERDGMLMMVDDARTQLLPGEKIERRSVRFRTLGCYPLTGAVESTASTLQEIVLEIIQARTSERQGRKIDSDGTASMERKKQEGYF